MFFQGQCLVNCPPKTYLFGTTACLACQSPCDECENEIKCKSCRKGYYWDSENCVKQCVDRTYSDDSTRTCIACDISCLECYGPSNKNCLVCDYFNKYGRSEENNAECTLIVCTDQMYLNINEVDKVAECLECHRTCKKCIGGGRKDCLECEANLLAAPGNTEETFLCKTCEERKVGYYTDVDGSCKGKLLNHL